MMIFDYFLYMIINIKIKIIKIIKILKIIKIIKILKINNQKSKSFSLP